MGACAPAGCRRFRGAAGVSTGAPVQGTARPLPQAGLGIASFVLSLGAGLLMVVLIVLVGFADFSSVGGLDEGAPATLLLGLGIFGAGLAEILALALGVAGVLQHDRRTLLAKLGMLMAASTLVGTAALVVVGTFS